MGQDFFDRQYCIPETCQFPCRCRSEPCQPRYDVGSVASISKIQKGKKVSNIFHVSDSVVHIIYQDFIFERSDKDCNFKLSGSELKTKNTDHRIWILEIM